MGLPGADKTTLARFLAPRLNAIIFNADEVRGNIDKHLARSEVGAILATIRRRKLLGRAG